MFQLNKMIKAISLSPGSGFQLFIETEIILNSGDSIRGWNGPNRRSLFEDLRLDSSSRKLR